MVYPRKAALAHNAAAVILAHNDASDVVEPSRADCSIMRRLVDALVLVDVRVINHLVFAGDTRVRLAELVKMIDIGLL